MPALGPRSRLQRPPQARPARRWQSWRRRWQAIGKPPRPWSAANFTQRRLPPRNRSCKAHCGRHYPIYEVSSNGTAGKLDGFLTIWWDKNSQLYQFFACFNNPDRPCHARGTAHWEGDVFVNDYEEIVDGKKTAWRDSFTFRPGSHTLVAAMNTDYEVWKTFITTTATRR